MGTLRYFLRKYDEEEEHAGIWYCKFQVINRKCVVSARDGVLFQAGCERHLTDC
jgi:hypothetical protein